MRARTFANWAQGVEVRADHVALLTGAGACLEVLAHALASAGEGVLLPSPIYPAFLNDFQVSESALCLRPGQRVRRGGTTGVKGQRA